MFFMANRFRVPGHELRSVERVGSRNGRLRMFQLTLMRRIGQISRNAKGKINYEPKLRGVCVCGGVGSRPFPKVILESVGRKFVEMLSRRLTNDFVERNCQLIFSKFGQSHVNSLSTYCSLA